MTVRDWCCRPNSGPAWLLSTVALAFHHGIGFSMQFGSWFLNCGNADLIYHLGQQQFAASWPRRICVILNGRVAQTAHACLGYVMPWHYVFKRTSRHMSCSNHNDVPLWQGTGGGLTLAKGTFEIPALTRHPKGEGKGSMVGMVWELWHRSMDVIVEKCHCEDFAWTCNVRRRKWISFWSEFVTDNFLYHEDRLRLKVSTFGFLAVFVWFATAHIIIDSKRMDRAAWNWAMVPSILVVHIGELEP